MLTTLFLTLAIGAPADAPKDKEDPPAKKELFAKEDWYKDQKGKEEEFVGKLEKVEGGGGIGFGRTNPYRLVMGDKDKKSVREVYVGGKPDLLAVYVGKQVKLTGKAVDMEVEGTQHHEIWPARLEVVAGDKKDDKKDDKSPKVLAHASWRGTGAQVARSAEELAKLMGRTADQAKEEAVQKEVTEALAKSLGVKEIDWKTQMVVAISAGSKPTGGYSVDIPDTTVMDKTLTVNWKLNSPKGIVTQAFTNPGGIALVERFDGEVKFDPEAPTAREKQ